MADKPETKPVEPPKPNQDLPKPDAPPRPTQLPAEDRRRQEEKEREKKEVLEKVQKILAEFGGAESNIPITHEYWVLLNQYRAKER